MLHLARRIYSSATILLKELLPSRPPPPNTHTGDSELEAPACRFLSQEPNSPVPSGSWAFLLVSLPSVSYFPVPSQFACCRCGLATLGPDAAYLEPIVTASVPLRCHSSARRGRWPSANQVLCFTQLSQSPPPFTLTGSRCG